MTETLSNDMDIVGKGGLTYEKTIVEGHINDKFSKMKEHINKQ